MVSDGYQKSLHRCVLDESSVSIGRVKLKKTDFPAERHSASYYVMICAACLIS